MPFRTANNDLFEEIDQDDKAELQLSVQDVYEPPTAKEVFGAAFRKENSLVSMGANMGTTMENFVPEDGYDPFANDGQDIKGYEMFASEFVDSVSPQHTEAIIQKIEQEFSDRRTLEDAGAFGVAAQMAAGATDPIYLVLQAMGVGTFRTAGSVLKIAGKMSAAGALGESIAEVAKHSSQTTRSIEESFLNIGGATVLSGILGGSVQGVKNLKSLSAKVKANIVDDVPEVVVAADVLESQKNFDLVNAAKIEQWGVSPLVRTSTSNALETKKIVNAMMETPLVTKGNVEGIATAPVGGTVETRIKMWDAPLAESLQGLDDSYIKYRQGKGTIRQTVENYVMRNRGSKLSMQEFREEIGKAMRRGDSSKIPEVAESAKRFRAKIYEPLKQRAIELNLLPDDVAVETAASYLSRVYKHKKIIAERDVWDGIVRRWLEGKRTTAILEKPTSSTAKLTDNDITDIINRTTNRILGTSSTRTPYESISIGKKGVFKERTFNIPDELIEDFLESDVDMLTRRLIATMAPDIELKSRFGSVDMTDQISKVKKEWDAKINKATTAKQRENFTKRQAADLEDIKAMRDRLRGTYKMPADPDAFFVRAGRALRDINFLRMLGGMTISAIPDLARTVAVNGLKPVAKQLRNLALSPRRLKLARLEAKKAAVGLDMVLNSRATSIAEIADVYGRRTRFERGLMAASDAFSKISLMSQWNSALKQFSGVVTSDRLMIESLNLAKGTAKKNAIRRLAQSGIDAKMAKRIATQFQKHGDDGTIKLINGDNWDDLEALETFRAAVLRDVDRTIVTPGKGEAPLWTSSEFGKLVFQFKTFASSAHHKILLADLQHRDSAALSGLLLSIGLGSVSYGLKQFVAGRDISKDPAKVIVESMDRSGSFGYFWDANNVLEKATRGNVGISPLLGAPPMSRYASRNVVGAIAGPSLGTATDILDVGGAVFSGDFRKRDVRTLRKLLPFQNLFYTRQLLNELEEKVQRRFPQ